MNEYINILITQNNSIIYTTELPLLYEGTSGNIYFNIEFENEIPENSCVELLFRRSDGDISPFLLTEKISGTYQFKLKGPWYFAKSGKLTYTVKVSNKISENVEEVLLTSYNSIPVLPNPSGLFIPAPLKPSEYDNLTDQIVTAKNDIANIKDKNPVVKLESGSQPIGEANPTIKYEKLDGSKGSITILLPQGLATENEVDTKLNNKFNTVNPIKKIEATNNDLQLNVTNYKNETSTITLKSEGLVKELEFEERLSEFSADLTGDLVVYSELQGSEDVAMMVAYAEEANKDSEGNIIKDTYLNKNALDQFVAADCYFNNGITTCGLSLDASLEKDKDLRTQIHISNNAPYAQLYITGANANDENGTFTFSIPSGNIQCLRSNKDDLRFNIDDVVLTNKSNVFTEPQTIYEQINLTNEDGTVDSIKHINNNFLISSSDGTNLLNIDSGLDKVTFFNKEVIFDEDLIEVETNLNADLNTLANKVVYIECLINGVAHRFAPNTEPISVLMNNNNLFAVKMNVSSNSVSVSEVFPITDSSSSYTPNITNIRTIKVGEL